MATNKLAMLIIGCLASASVVSCAAATTSLELQNARSAYQTAEQSDAKDEVPEHLLSAEQALQKAERAHKSSENSSWSKTLAYIAERQAQLAVVLASSARAAKRAALSETRYATLLEDSNRSANKDLGRTQNELARTRTELEKQEAALATKQDTLKQREAELESKTGELDQERKARVAAEAKANAALASLEEIGRVKEEARGMVITLSGAVMFKTNDAVLLQIAERQLAKVAEALQEQDESKKIVIEGHTDSRGSDRSNRVLSQDRANSVRIYLISEGVSPQRISAIGKGESEPIADNKTAEGRANNRRVEIIVGR